MKLFKLFLLLNVFLMLSCKDLGNVRSKVKKGISGQEGMQPKDLSTMPTEKAIQTKYKKLDFLCDGAVEVELVKDGAILRDKKEIHITWNITSNTVLIKTLSLEDKVLNLTLTFKVPLVLNMDEKFNTLATGAPAYEIKTYANDGTLMTSVISDGLKKPFVLKENELIKVIDMNLDSGENKTANKVLMTCQFVSDVYSQYKN